jgi:hypothetical protein
MKTPRPVLIMNSVLAGLLFIGGGVALAEWVDPKVVGLANLVLGGIALGWTKYTEGQVTPNQTVAQEFTPNEQVAAVVLPGAEEYGETPQVVAGPASPLQDGTPVHLVETA